MSSPAAPCSTVHPRPAAAIFWAGLACGVLDITAAFVTWALKGVAPIRILQAIASGLLGAEAFKGGAATAALGAGLHFLIAFTAATVFYLASRRLAFLTQRAVVWGLAYGATVYLFMYWVVQPLSLVRRGPFSLTTHAIALVTHFLCVGLPISLIVRRYST